MTPILALWLAATLVTSARADDVIVVTATRLETPADQLASSTSVIDREQIERGRQDSVTDLLRNVPGVSVSSGGPGAVPSIFLRGIDSGHVLVLVDGIKINDPTQTNGGFDLGSLNPGEIERIEIIRGAQSVMYGSNAVGGVIHIITRKGGKNRLFRGEAEFGSFRTYRTELGARGQEQGLNYSLNAEMKGAEGFSSASESLGNTEKDGFSSMTFSSRLDGEPAEKLKLDGSLHYSFKRFDIDSGGGAPTSLGGDDPNHEGEEKRLLGRLELQSKRSSVWEPIIGLSYILNQKRFDDDADPLHAFSSHNTYDSSRVRADWQNNFYVNDQHTLTLGLVSEREQASFTENSSLSGDFTASDRSDWSVSAFGQHQYLSDTFFYAIGGRFDHHERFDSVFTFREAPGVQIPGTGLTLKGSWGSGFKAPTLYQLYSSYGSESLQAEKSLSLDLGFEQKLLQNRVVIGVTGFYSRIREQIDYDNASRKFMNIAESSSRGAEAELKVRPSAALSSRAAYTYTLAINNITGELLRRRPRHQASWEGSYEFARESSVTLAWRYLGERTDTDAATFLTTDMPAYSTLALSGAYLLGGGLRIFGRVENLLDSAYEEMDGYGTAGRSFYLGLRKEL